MTTTAVGVASKLCRRCDEIKPLEGFAKMAAAPDGLQYLCRSCSTKAQRHRREIRGEQHRAYMRTWYYQKHYGITIEQYDALLEQQAGVCGICLGPPNGRGDHFHVDHDHETGEVRGLLCTSCNQGIGRFGDDPDRLEAAARYLRDRRM